MNGVWGLCSGGSSEAFIGAEAMAASQVWILGFCRVRVLWGTMRCIGIFL
jgi:hypothetical protein